MSRQLAYAAVFVLALVAARVTQYPHRLLAVPAGLVLALSWCWLSVIWAVDPAISFRRVMLTTLVIWLLFMITQEMNFGKIINIVRIVLLLALLANYIAVLLWPAFGIHQMAQVGDPELVGNWRGILTQKNFAGTICAITIIIYVFASRDLHPVARWGVIIATAYFLYKTSSKTSIGLLLPALAVGWLYGKYNPLYKPLLLLGLFALGGLAALIGYSYWDELLAPFNRTDSLSGRVQIWPVLLSYAQDHWLLGSGYGSFWQIGSISPVYQYSNKWVALAGNGHNGYLDLLAQTGLPGLVMVVFAAIVLPFTKLLVSTTTARPRGALLIALMVFCAGHNVTETSLFERDTIVQVFLMLTVALIYSETRSSRIERSTYEGHRV